MRRQNFHYEEASGKGAKAEASDEGQSYYRYFNHLETIIKFMLLAQYRFA